MPWERRASALADLVELLDPASLVVWTADRGAARRDRALRRRGRHRCPARHGRRAQAGLILAFDLPDTDRLRQLLTAGEVVLLVPPATGRLRGADRRASAAGPAAGPARRRHAPRPARAGPRSCARSRAGSRTRALLTLAPLFERYDPTAVAAAFSTCGPRARGTAPAALPGHPGTARVYVGVGKKDGATVNDIVAVLTKEVRVERAKIGRVELRDAFTLVELPAQEAERIARALTGTTYPAKAGDRAGGPGPRAEAGRRAHLGPSRGRRPDALALPVHQLLQRPAGPERRARSRP